MSISLYSGEICNSLKMEMWAGVLSSWLTKLYLGKEELVVACLEFVTGPSKITLEAWPRVTTIDYYFLFLSLIMITFKTSLNPEIMLMVLS